MKSCFYIEQTMYKADLDSVKCATNCGPVPEFPCYEQDRLHIATDLYSCLQNSKVPLKQHLCQHFLFKIIG